MPVVTASHRGPIGVVGLWHLGSVTAACLAAAGYEVIGVDTDTALVEQLSQGHPPVAEPGLAELIADNASRLRFSNDPTALAAASCAWVTFDTPVDDDDKADVEWVLARCEQLLAPLEHRALVLVSSQLPVGSVARLRQRCAAGRDNDHDLRFACVPENLRLGDAVRSFREPDRIVVGLAAEEDRAEIAALMDPFGVDIEWMGVESAEMTKHALNGFLATSVAFINEVAAICESVGADAAEVSRGLKSDRRIGPRAYLAPGDAFAGGTLARDIGFLRGLAERHGLPADVLAGVAAGNAEHKAWSRRKLLELAGDDDRRLVSGLTVAVWGLAYKPGTDTLRRSSALELCRWLAGEGAWVRVHDPAVASLPPDLGPEVELCDRPLAAVARADALVVCTAWPEYRAIAGEAVFAAMSSPVVIDAAGFLAETLGAYPDLRYTRVGSLTSQEPVSTPNDSRRPEAARER